ncbi:MAG: hypothetical protein ABIP48_24625 [Planctomycetota bacterium]
MNQGIIAVRTLYRLPTVGTIAQRLGVLPHRVVYVIESRGIEPIGQAGHARVFAEAAVDRIASELKRIDADREGVQ